MSYCINPWCLKRRNPDHREYCQECDTELLINERYTLVNLLHKNENFGTEVWLAKDCEQNEKVIKTLSGNKPSCVKLFEREVQILQQLTHPGIPTLTTGLCNGPKNIRFFVLDKIEGENLNKWITNHGPISQELALEWLEELTNILDYLHQQKFFHRDIKPSNIMRTLDGKLILLDFGAAREITGTFLEKINQKQKTTSIYSEGGYTPIEEILGQAVPQSDFFSLGRTFIYLLTGKQPNEFETSDDGKSISWRESLPEFSEAFADLLDDLMAPLPEQRPQTTQQILERLTQINLCANKLVAQKQSQEKSPLLSWTNIVKVAPLLLLGIITSSLFIKPRIASYLNDLGLKNYHNGQFFQARQYFQLATFVNYSSPEAHYNLGWFCDAKLDDLNCAKKSYEKAMLLGFPAANAELARLQILDNNLTPALKTVEGGLELAKYDGDQAALLKNRGWIRWNQKRLDEAENDLKTAIKLIHDSPHSHCLLAEVLEAKGKEKEALEAWKNTLKYSKPRVYEQDQCIGKAKQRLGKQEES